MPYGYSGKSQEEEARDLKEQIMTLRNHCSAERKRMSVTIPDMIRYCKDTMASDPFIYPVRENPFKEKKSCNLL